MDYLGLRVLLLEDEPLVALLLRELLEGFGCEVTEAASVTAALQMLDTFEFEAALLDLHVKGRLAYPVADRLRARGVNFAFTSGAGHGAIRAEDAGVPFVEKPFVESGLIRLMGQLGRRTVQVV